MFGIWAQNVILSQHSITLSASPQIMCNRLDRTWLFARQKRQAAWLRPDAGIFVLKQLNFSLSSPASDPKSRHESVSTVQQNIRCLVFCCYTMCSHNVKLCATGIVCELLLLARNSTTSYASPFAYLWYENNFDWTTFVYSSCYQHRRIAGKQ